MSDLYMVYNRGGGVPGATVDDSFVSLLKDALTAPQREFFILKLRYRFGT